MLRNASSSLATTSDWSNPAPNWRRRTSQVFMKFISRIMMFCAGFYWVKLVDHTKNSNKDPIKYPKFSITEPYPLVGNHLTLIDIISVGQFAGPVSFLAKDALTKVPVVSFLLKAFRSIIVERRDRDEKVDQDKNNKDKNESDSQQQNSLGQLTDRITNEPNTLYRPLVFAEGTTGNGKQITRFRKGAFISGKPVRLFTIRYISPHCSCSWESVELFYYLYDMVTQFYMNFEMHVYDLYYPNEDEIEDPDLYAKNCGQFVADELKMPYRHDVDIAYKFILLDILKGKITWDEALEQVKQDEEKRENVQMKEYSDNYEHEKQIKKKDD
ncbi:MAG: putative lysophospholipid acyltransferase LPEAT1 [Streblomastix strix]|uniref:Putative lysophospholipid acyltransferase LPEAT1 n=1 Tax=Streblomastix strix TaxID=222440 RepID=A0A5J4VQT7_9EUKA|nr:MAG: putative lysophospholipid acyltransferase LPEAT1 [Streblomastix strix]